MKILYHHRTQAEDGQAVHIRALQRAFRAEGHEVVEFALVRRAPDGAPPERPERLSPWALVARAPRFVTLPKQLWFWRALVHDCRHWSKTH